MNGHSNILLVAALSTTLVLAGCIDSITGTGDDLDTNLADGNGLVVLRVNAENIPSDLSHFEIDFSGAFVHDAATPMPEGYVALSTKGGGGGTIVHAGDATSLKLAEGEVPAGTYDQVLLRFTSAKAVRGDAAMEDDGHDHEEDTGAHAHEPSGTGMGAIEVSDPNGIDIPINLTFEVADGKTTEIELVFDGTGSTADGTFTPVIARATITRDGNLVDELTDVEVAAKSTGPRTTTSTAKPVARIAVFGPDGAQVFKPDFLAEDGSFTNPPSSPFPVDANVTFSGTDSEAVEASATIDSYAWDFDDGTTATGATVAHSFDGPGVFEVTLTVTDTKGAEDSHLVRVIVLGWSTTTYTTGFEEADEAWTVTNADLAGVAGATGLSGWARDGPGHASATSYHVGLHLHEIIEGYLPLADSTLVSPELEVPADWTSAGFELFLSGASESGFDILTVTYTIDGGDPITVGEFSGDMAWTNVGADDALNEAIGKTVQFTFHFHADELQQGGGGWFVDNLTLGGVDAELKNPELLELAKSGSDGHDHEH